MKRTYFALFIVSLLAIASHGLPTASMSLFHKSANIPNNAMITVHLDTPLDSLEYKAVLNLNSVTDLTIFSSGNYGECFVSPDTSFSTILEAHLFDFGRVPCYYEEFRVVVLLANDIIRGSDSIQILIKDLKFTAKKTYAFPIDVTRDIRGSGLPITSVSAEIIDDTLTSSDLSGLSFHHSGFYINLSNLTTRTPNLDEYKFYLELKNFEDVKTASNITNYINSVTSLKDMEFNLTSADFRSTTFIPIMDTGANALWLAFEIENNTASTDLLGRNLYIGLKNYTLSYVLNKGARLWVFSKSMLQPVYFDENIELGYYTAIQATAAAYETVHYGPIWMINITLNETIYSWQNPIINVNFTNATHHCRALAIHHDCAISPFDAFPYVGTFRPVSSREVEISNYQTYYFGQRIQLHFNMSFDRANRMNLMPIRVTMYTAPTGTRTTLASVTATTTGFNRTIHGFKNFLYPIYYQPPRVSSNTPGKYNLTFIFYLDIPPYFSPGDTFELFAFYNAPLNITPSQVRFTAHTGISQDGWFTNIRIFPEQRQVTFITTQALVASTLQYWIHLENVSIAEEVFQSSRFRPYFTMNIKRKVFNTWDFSQTFPLIFNIENKFNAILTQSNSLESQWSIYKLTLPFSIQMDSTSSILVRFNSEYELYTGRTEYLSISNSSQYTIIENGNNPSTVSYYGQREIVITNPNFGNVQNASVSFVAKNPSFSGTTSINVIVIDDSTGNRNYLSNYTLFPNILQIPKMTDTNEFQHMVAQLTDPYNTNPYLTVNFSTFNQTCTSVNPNIGILDETCLGNRQTCLASGNCTLNNNLDLVGNRDLDTLILNLSSKFDLNSNTKCYLNNKMLNPTIFREETQDITVLNFSLNTPVARNVIHTLKCYDLLYKVGTQNNMNATLTLYSNRTFVAQSSKPIVAPWRNSFELKMTSHSNLIKNWKNSIQFEVTPNFDFDNNIELLLNLPNGYGFNSETFCTGYTSSFSMICSPSFVSDTQLKVQLLSIFKGDKLIIYLDQVTIPSSIPASSSFVTLQAFESPSRMYNYTTSVLHPELADSFMNQSTRKLQYLYTVSTVNADSTIDFTCSLTFPKNISGSELQLFFPSTLSLFGASFKIYQGDELEQIEVTKVYKNDGNVLLSLASVVNGNTKLVIKLFGLSGSSYTANDEIALQVISNNVYVQRFSSTAYSGVLHFPQSYGFLNSNGKAPIVITADIIGSIPIASHSVKIAFNEVNLNSPKCYLIKQAANDDFFNIVDKISAESLRALELACTQTGNSVTFSNYVQTPEHKIKGSLIIGDLSSQTNLVKNGDVSAIVIISSSIELTGTPNFDITVYHGVNVYDQKTAVPIQIQNQNSFTSLDHDLYVDNSNNGEYNTLSFSFSVSAAQNYLSNIVLEPSAKMLSNPSLLDAEDIMCSVSINSVIQQTLCNYNFLDGNIYIQSFNISTGLNSILITISNIRNYEEHDFVGSYVVRIVEGTTGNIIYQFNQNTAVSNNFESLNYKNNILGVFGEDAQSIKSILQGKDAFGNSITIKDKLNLLINQRLSAAPSIWRVNFTPSLKLDDVTEEFIIENGDKKLEKLTIGNRLRIAGFESGLYLVSFNLINSLAFKNPGYLLTETFALYITDEIPTFTYTKPESISSGSLNVPIQIFSSNSMPYDAKIKVDFISSDPELVNSLVASNPSTYSLVSSITTASLSTQFTGSFTGPLTYSVNIYIGRYQDVLAATLSIPLTITAYEDNLLTFTEFEVTSTSKNTACFSAQMNKVGKLTFMITNYPVSQSFSLFNDIGYQNSTLYLEGDTETLFDLLESSDLPAEITFYQHEIWSYSGVDRERISGKLLIPSAGSSHSICVSGLNPEESYNVYYFGSDIQNQNTSIGVATFQTDPELYGEAKFRLRFNRSVSLEEINSEIIPVISQYLSLDESWLKVDGDMIFELGSSFPSQSISEFLSAPLNRVDNEYGFKFTIPKLLSSQDVASVIESLKIKIPYLNSILKTDAGFITSFNPSTTLTFQPKPARSILKLELLANPFRGYSGDVVFPVNVENVNRLHVLVLKLSSFESYNMAYNNIPLSSEEIADKDFKVPNTVCYRFYYDLSDHKLVSLLEEKDSIIDIDIDLQVTGTNTVNYSENRVSEINGKPVEYVAIPFNDNGVFRVYISGEHLIGNEIYPTHSQNLPSEIRNSPELASLLLGEVDNWKILLNDDSVIAEDIKSTDGGILAEIPNFLSILDGERIGLKIFGLFMIVCAFMLL